MQVRIKRKEMYQEWEVGYAVGHTRCWPGWSQVYATDRDRDEQIDRQTDRQNGQSCRVLALTYWVGD